MTEPLSIIPVSDPLAPDAPIHHLLSIRHNPLIKDATPDELRAIIQKLRTLASSSPTLSAKLNSDSDNVNPRKRKQSVETAARKDFLSQL